MGFLSAGSVATLLSTKHPADPKPIAEVIGRDI